MSMKNTAFEQEQTNAFYPDGIQNHYWQRTRSSIIYDQLKKYDLLHNKFIEIGCGRGQVVESLFIAGVDIVGVEVADVEPFEFVRAKVYAKKLASEISKEEREVFTGIFLLDVIEHIEDPIVFINNIFSDYPNTKYLVITVPAMKNLWSNFDVYVRHFRRYELADMNGIAEGTRSKIINRGYFPHLLYSMAQLLLK